MARADHDRLAPEGRLALVVVATTVAVIGMNTTAINVTARTMAGDLELGVVSVAWVANAYLLAGAAFALIGGRLGDDLGRTRALALGCAVFALGSLTAAVSGATGVLFVGRVLQGIGAAFVLPAGIEVLHALSDPERERFGYRIRGVVYASAFGIGPFVGAVATDLAGWRAFFVVEIVVMGTAAALATRLRKGPRRGRRRRTDDLLGALLAVPLVALAILLVERAKSWGAVVWPTGVVAGVVVALAVAFVGVERRRDHPLLHLSLLRRRRLVGANVAVLGASIGMLGLLYWFNVFAQSAAVFSRDALSVVVMFVPFTLSIIVYTQIAVWLRTRVGATGPVLVGLGLSAAGFFWLSLAGPDTTEAQLLVPLAICGLGAGVANAGLVSLAVLDLPSGRLDEAAGITTLMRFAGSALAIAIGSSAFLAVQPTGALASEPVAQQAAITSDVAAVGATTFDRAVARLDADLTQRVLAAARSDATTAFTQTMRWAGAIVLALAVLAAWLLWPTRRGPEAVVGGSGGAL
ncbi:MAG: MFS transporter [Acidimicrobiales bacterium]